MTVKRLIGIIVFIILTSFSVSAQTLFNADLIIKKNGDTLKGQIDFRNIEKTPNSIKFRPNNSSIELVFRPNDIKGFIVEDGQQIYESTYLKINKDARTFTNTNTYNSITEAINDTNWQYDTLFLLVLAKGSINLFQYIDENGNNHYFINKENSDYDPLINSVVKLRQYGSIKITYLEEFKENLRLNCIDLPNLDFYIKNLNFNTASISTLISNYNKFKNQSQYNSSFKKYKAQYYACVGINLNQIKIKDANAYVTRLNAVWTPTLSLGLALISSRYKLGTIGTELNISQMSANDSVNYGTGGRQVFYNFSNLSVNFLPYIQINHVFNRYTSQNTTAIYLKGGLILSYFIKHDYNNYFSSTPLNVFDTNDKGFGVNATCGIRHNRFFLEMRFGKYLSKIASTRFQTFLYYRASFMLGYNF